MALTLTADERTELDRRTRSRKIRAEDVYRPMESAIRNRASRRAAPEVSRTSAHGAHAGARGARAGEDAAEAIRRQQHWTTRNLANVLGISHMLVARVWRRAGYQPHRFERYMLSDDPQFDKAADVIGLYLNPPQHAVVLAADEKTAIQALDRLDPVLPLPPGRVERHGFEYYRQGALSLSPR